MAEIQESQPAEPDALKKRLIARVGVAGLLIVVLLAVLALFESYSKRELAPPSAVMRAPMPIAPSAPPAPPQPEKPTETPPEVLPEQAAEAATESMKEIEPRAEPEYTAPPTLAPRPSLSRREAAARPSVAPAPARKAEEQLPAVPAILQPPRPTPAVAAGFVIQLGVFTNVANAEELHAKLTRSGIPSQIEARVFAGPFKSKQDADAAQAKLKAAGLQAGLLLPFRTR